MSISDAIHQYLAAISDSRADKTIAAYKNGLAKFQQALEQNGLPPESTPLVALKESSISWLAQLLKTEGKMDATKRLYLSSAVSFFTYLIAEDLLEVNLPRLRQLVDLYSTRQSLQFPQFPQQKIEALIEFALRLPEQPADSNRKRLLNLRDAAFIVTLADTGLRVHEACRLLRGDIVWEEGKAVITGKGNTQAVIRFSNRSLQLMRNYVNERQLVEGSFGKPLASLPVFSGHSRNQDSKRKDDAQGKHKGLTSLTTRNAGRLVERRVTEALAPEDVGTITPHSFRHYFVTSVLLGSGGDMRLAQELARHSNIATTQRYTHLTDDRLDKGYHEIFNQGR
jgi:site-specific recombinase XerD